MREHEAVIEVPLWGFRKMHSDGTLDYVSPLPCPFNYGCVPGTLSDDGEPIDAIVLGPRLARGTRIRLPERARVAFVDAGADDPKLVLSAHPLSGRERRRLTGFFLLYTPMKRLLNRLRGRSGPTRFAGLVVSSNR